MIKVKEHTRNISKLNVPPEVVQEPAAAEDSAAKSKGWKERLEKLKIKKQEEKKIVETTTGQDLDTEGRDLRDEFAPTSGIKKGTDGHLTVNRQEVKDKP